MQISTERTPSVMRDGRLPWMRSESLDKGANFGHTLWAIRPDGAQPELIFGSNTINCCANGREAPGTSDWTGTPVHKVSGPHGWPSHVAKGVLGPVPAEAGGSASFFAPDGKVLQFQALGENFNEQQRLRSAVLSRSQRQGPNQPHRRAWS
jgi:hypothetical protein